jgi:hypothetical protein
MTVQNELEKITTDVKERNQIINLKHPKQPLHTRQNPENSTVKTVCVNCVDTLRQFLIPVYSISQWQN